MVDQLSGLNKDYYLELPYEIDLAALERSIKMRAIDTDLSVVVNRLVEVVKPIARPKAVFRPMIVENLLDSSFNLGGVTFSSRVLTKVLRKGDVIFPYIVTIGEELDVFCPPNNDMLEKFRLDAVKTAVLLAAGRSFEILLKKQYPERRLTHINPGEIDDWPLIQQRQVFQLLEGSIEQMGVQLTEGCMIKPVKSRSGIYFANDDGFETCRLCTQYRCAGRRAAFDAPTLVRMTA